jgi:hypothetical protein
MIIYKKKIKEILAFVYDFNKTIIIFVYTIAWHLVFKYDLNV